MESFFLVDYDLLLLDEPTNHLDLESTEWLVSFLKNYKGALLVVTHDRYLIRNVGNRFWELNGGSLWDFSGPYDRYQADREIMLKSGLRTRDNLSKEIERLDSVAKRYRLGAGKFIKQAINKRKTKGQTNRTARIDRSPQMKKSEEQNSAYHNQIEPVTQF